MATDFRSASGQRSTERSAWRRRGRCPGTEATPLDPFLDFFEAIRDGREALVNFDDAVRVQAVLDAAERSAAGGGVWVDLPTDG